MDDEKDIVNGEQGENVGLAEALKIAISQSSISSFSYVADALHQFRELNNSLMTEITNVFAVQEKLNQNISRSLAVNADFSKLIETQNIVQDISAAISSPIQEALYSANLSIGNLFDNTNGIAKSLDYLSPISEIWQSQLKPMESVFGTVQSSKIVLDSYLSRMSEMSVLAQASVQQLPWDQIGSSLEIETSVRNAIQSNFLDLAEEYSGLFSSLEKNPTDIFSLPPITLELPSVELFNETSLLESVTTQDAENIELVDQKQEIKEQIQADTDSKLITLLKEIDDNLVSLLEGAQFALQSDHPDHVRHFATSLRELFTHVLHMLAPDSELERWTNDSAHYHKQRPTRKARMLYICRSINKEPFTKFVERDIEATITFLDLFQGGTHKIATNYSREQLTAMLIRMEGTLRFLLEIDNAR
jgi:hypothetical protein